MWANLPRRKCDDCGKSYKPVRPVKENERGFCTPNCRKSYHKHGGAYRKLKVEMKRMVEREMQKIRLELFRALSLHMESAHHKTDPLDIALKFAKGMNAAQ